MTNKAGQKANGMKGWRELKRCRVRKKKSKGKVDDYAKSDERVTKKKDAEEKLDD